MPGTISFFRETSHFPFPVSSFQYNLRDLQISDIELKVGRRRLNISTRQCREFLQWSNTRFSDNKSHIFSVRSCLAQHCITDTWASQEPTMSVSQSVSRSGLAFICQTQSPFDAKLRPKTHFNFFGCSFVYVVRKVFFFVVCMFFVFSIIYKKWYFCSSYLFWKYSRIIVFL